MNAPQTVPFLDRLADPLVTFKSLSRAICHTGRAAICLALLAAACRAAESTPGEDIFRTHCADCHGAAGEGTADNYPRPLVGERSPAQLARFISQSMPPDAAGSVAGADAEQLAKFVYDAFYSKDAQARRRPPRIELGHLTNRQLQHSIGDLFLAFRQSVPWTDQRGLQGQYASIAANGDGKLQLTRVDPLVKFDFGKSSPAPDKIEPAEFAISWIGSLHAPETADYEFIVRSDNSVKLHVADLKTPLIDAWIKSGDQTEFRGTVHLLGGRVYPVQLYFTKAGQGVAKTEQLRARVAPATVSLEWKLPERVAEVVPTRRLSPQPEPETLLVSSAFPPDDRSTGVERGTSISPEWDRATTAAALEAAEYTLSRLGDLAGVAEASRENESRLRDFGRRFAELAFRRPLTADQQRIYVDAHFDQSSDLEASLQRVVMMVLKSPRFLYPGMSGAPRDGYDVAARLALVLWDSLPDGTLLKAAAEGHLSMREQVVAEAQRMVGDFRFQAKLWEFFVQWMKLENVRDLKKDAAQFPEFNAAVASDLRTSLELFLEEVLGDPRADFRELLTARYLHLNGNLARLYGAALPADAPFQKVAVDADQRAGVLSHPFVMTAFADTVSSSPIRRGVFVLRSVLGKTLRPPPEAVTPLPPALHPDLTTRERVIVQTSSQNCQSCHGLINPLGFALERFDALGRLRSEDNRRPVDAAGTYLSAAGDTVSFSGAGELGRFLAGSEEVHTALIEKLFYYSVKQPVRAYGLKALPELRASLARQEFNLRGLMVEIAALAATGGP